MKKLRWALALSILAYIVARSYAPDHRSDTSDAHPDGSQCPWDPAEVIIRRNASGLPVMFMCLSCAQEWFVEIDGIPVSRR